MTVAELIEQLTRLPQSLEVVIPGGGMQETFPVPAKGVRGARYAHVDGYLIDLENCEGDPLTVVVAEIF